MQRQIEVYDRDGRVRSSQSDLPPELAAAVAQRKAAEGQVTPIIPRFDESALFVDCRWAGHLVKIHVCLFAGYDSH